LILKHLTEEGLGDAVDNVEWWINGVETYYCPASFLLSHMKRRKSEVVSRRTIFT
jgi:hypothetical protein